MAEQPIRIDFGTQSDPGKNTQHGPRHVNAYVAQVIEGKTPLPIYASDGLTDFVTVTSGAACRGMIEFGNDLIALSGNRLMRIDSGGAQTLIGGIPGESLVSLARNDKTAGNGPQVVLVVDGQKFVVEDNGFGTNTLALSPITDTDLPPANSCTFLNQRIIYGTKKGFYWSDVNEATSINALNFITAEGQPDDVVRVIQHLQEIWVFGDRTTEVWRDTGATSAPFRRNQGVVIPLGCLAAASVQELDKDLIWIGDDGSVYRAQGYNFDRISNHSVEDAIDDTVDKAAIEGMARKTRGHHFYTISGPDWTWEFNRTTSKWLERESSGLTRWRASCQSPFGDSVVVGDFSNGKLYKISDTAYDEAGTTMVWLIRTAPMHAWPNRLSVYRLFADFTTGVGLNSTDPHESEPKVAMRFSDDGGKTWSDELTRSLGKIGERLVQVQWEGLGDTGRSGRIWELRVSSPVVRELSFIGIDGDSIAP